MSSSQGAAGGSKNTKKDPRGRRRGSYVMILLGIALFIGALFLYLYYVSKRPRVMTESGDITNINRTKSDARAEPPRPAASPTASP